MTEAVLSRLKTKKECQELLSEIDILINSLYTQQDGGFESALHTHVRAWVAKSILEDLASGNKNKEEYLKNIREEAEKIDPIVICVAYDPPDSSIELWSEIIKKNRGSNSIIDIHFDPELIAGAKITCGGKYKDYTLKKTFNEYMEKLKGTV